MTILQCLTKIYIILLVTFTKKGERDIIMEQNNMNDSNEENGMSQIDLASGCVCHIEVNGQHANQVTLTIAHKKTRVAMCVIKTSREFLSGAKYTMVVATKPFVNTEEVKTTKTVAKVKHGMCKVTGMISPNTKIKHSFPVDDDFSWGKTVFTVGDWDQVVEELLLM